MTDDYLTYQSLTKQGYKHETVNHGAKEYVPGDLLFHGRYLTLENV